VFIVVTERPKQHSDLLRPVLRPSNITQGIAGSRAPSLHALEQQTLELTAILWPLAVNPAPASVQSQAGLRKLRMSGFGLRISAKPTSGPLLCCSVLEFPERQPERLQPLWIIPRLQLHIGKDHPVATQAAFQAQGFRIGTD
jgi:hypothetical protein